jgi:MFS family permease
MSESQTRVIIILLAGILFVLVVGREAALTALTWGFWIALALGILALFLWVIIAFLRWGQRETKAFSESVAKERREGKPWLFGIVGVVGMLGNFAVFGLAALNYYGGTCASFKKDCLNQIPFWYLPVPILLLSFPIHWVENLILRLRKPRNSGELEK